MTKAKTSPIVKPEMFRALIECSRNMYTLVDNEGLILYQSSSNVLVIPVLIIISSNIALLPHFDYLRVQVLSLSH